MIPFPLTEAQRVALWLCLTGIPELLAPTCHEVMLFSLSPLHLNCPNPHESASPFPDLPLLRLSAILIVNTENHLLEDAT